MLVSMWFLYPAVRSFYTAHREQQILAMQLEAYETLNAELQEENAQLLTNDGVAVAARELGLVEEGEVAVEVKGETDSTQSTSSSSSVTNSLLHEEEAQETISNASWPWYINLADFFLNFDPSEV